MPQRLCLSLAFACRLGGLFALPALLAFASCLHPAVSIAAHTPTNHSPSRAWVQPAAPVMVASASPRAGMRGSHRQGAAQLPTGLYPAVAAAERTAVQPHIAGQTVTLGPSSTLSGPDVGAFGHAVALSRDGTEALIGADGYAYGLPGRAYLFTRPAGGAWPSTPTAVFTDPGNPPNSGFGSEVALSGDGSTALIATSSGPAYVFVKSSGGTWTGTPSATLSPPVGAAGFGTRLAISDNGGIVLVGASQTTFGPGGTPVTGCNSGDTCYAGIAYVFVRPSGGWASGGALTPFQITPTQPVANSYFGTAVALSGDGTTVAIGALNEDVYIFMEGSGWTNSANPAATLSPSGAVAFGRAVALSDTGAVAIIGDNETTVNGNSYAGAAYIYTEPSGGWSGNPNPAAEISDPAGAASDFFGSVVGLSADGATAFVDDGPSAGGYVFLKPSTGSWANTSTASATLSDPNSGDSRSGSGSGFGAAAALSADGGTILIGAFAFNGGENTNGQGGAGTAYAFARPSSGVWSGTLAPSSTLTASTVPPALGFGLSVALSDNGNTAVVGAYQTNHSTGAAFIFVKPSGGTWSDMTAPTSALSVSGLGANSQFGYAVAVSSDGSTVMVGAPISGSGKVYVFTRPSSGTWLAQTTPTASISDPGVFSGASFGSSVALSHDGSTVLIGSPRGFSSSADRDTGAAYIYLRPSTGWGGSLSFDYYVYYTGDEDFGQTLALSGDGSTVLVPSPSVGDAAYIWSEASSAAWATSSPQFATLPDPGKSTNDDFGSSVALNNDGSVALVGADAVNIGGNGPGAAYVFAKPGAGGWSGTVSSSATLSLPAGSPLSFGSAASLSDDGNTVLIAAANGNPDGGCSNCGADGGVYVFNKCPGMPWTTSSTPAATLTAPGTTTAGFGQGQVALSAFSDGGVAALVGTGQDYRAVVQPAQLPACMPVTTGWNALTLPLDPQGALTANGLLTSLLNDTAGSSAALAEYVNGRYQLAVVSGGQAYTSDFSLQLAQGYFLLSDRSGTLIDPGALPTSPPTVHLNPGWDFIGLPLASSSQNAQSVLTSLSSAGLKPQEVANYVGGTWQTYTQTGTGTYTGTNFPLSNQRGYFVQVQQGGNWQEQLS